jgi:hypothetical protein
MQYLYDTKKVAIVQTSPQNAQLLEELKAIVDNQGRFLFQLYINILGTQPLSTIVESLTRQMQM